MLKNVPAHLENSLELITCIQTGDSSTNTNIFTQPRCGVPVYFNTHRGAITNAVDRIRNPMPKQYITDLLTVTLNNMYFSLNGQVFHQKEGLPMDSSISGILAILFMDKLETIALSSHLSISPYRRYVDDIYLQTTGEKWQTNSTTQ